MLNTNLSAKGSDKGRRREPRYKVNLSIVYHSGCVCSDIDGSTADEVSNHGFCLWRPEEIATGDIIKFELGVENTPVFGSAQIKWSSNRGPVNKKKVPSSRVGCRIISMTKKYQDVLKDFLSNQPVSSYLY